MVLSPAYLSAIGLANINLARRAVSRSQRDLGLEAAGMIFVQTFDCVDGIHASSLRLEMRRRPFAGLTGELDH
jgi:hypothetical protein